MATHKIVKRTRFAYIPQNMLEEEEEIQMTVLISVAHVGSLVQCCHGQPRDTYACSNTPSLRDSPSQY